MKKVLNILLIEDSPEFAEVVQQWLSSGTNEGEFALNWTDTLMTGLNRVARGGVDVILLDLGLPDSSGLETFTRARVQINGVPIIVLTNQDDELLALHLVKEGAQDYIIKSACTADVLAKAIRCSALRSGTQAVSPGGTLPAGQPKIIGVMGAKGGVGATTVACNLATELRRQTDQPTLLADLNLQAGLVAFVMNVGSEYSILDAVSNIHRLDASVWEPIVVRAAGDLHIVRSPSSLGGADPEAGQIRHVLTFIRTLYRWAVLDLGRISAFSMNVLDKVDELFLITSNSIPGLYEAKRAIEALVRIGVAGDRLRLIVNHLDDMPDFSERELSRILAVPVHAKLPNAGDQLHQSVAQQKLIAENSEFGEQIGRLARQVAGRPEEKRKRRFSQLLSFAAGPQS